MAIRFHPRGHSTERVHMNIPSFSAEASLVSRGVRYQATSDRMADSEVPVIVLQWYCCIMRPTYGGPVVGCRGHNAWYPFASAACGAEAAWNQLSATLVEGRCSDQPQCQGKIW
jgi:hypothetical protein